MSDHPSIVRTRIAPSPTGQIHIGTIAIALKNLAFARKNHGQFILRIEDTDKTREVENGVTLITDQLKAYHITWDEGPDIGGNFGPYLQSERLDIYHKYAMQLIQDGKAYYCFCSKEDLEKERQNAMDNHQLPRYSGKCRHLNAANVAAKLKEKLPYVIRLKVPHNQEIVFNDWIRGKISFNSDQVDDQVLIKSDGFPTYHLAVVVDDYLMQITHVLRGEEWISSTPKHILLYQAFGWQPPVFAHIPVFLNPNGKGKMSKRHGDVTAESFIQKGYLVEAVLNFLMILGWTPQDQREFLSLDEYINEFDPRDLSQKSVAFDFKKLDWMNGQYIRKLTDEELKERLEPYIPTDCPVSLLPDMISLVKERLVLLSDFENLTSYFYRDIKLEKNQIDSKLSPPEIKEVLQTTIVVLLATKVWDNQTLETNLRQMVADHNWHVGHVFMLIRTVVTGQTKTPPLFDTLRVIGQEKTMQRLQETVKLF